MVRLLVAVGAALALWMAAGRWLFGIGGALTWWYLPTIGLVYLALHLWLAQRIRITRNRGRRTGRSTVVSLALSWTCALGFGLTVPDLSGGELVSLLSLAAGSTMSSEMSIALCNPLGIIAFACLIASLAFAYADVRDPRPEEDDDEDLEGGGMVPHPLA